MTNPIDRAFAERRAAGKLALMPFLPAGDPDIAATVTFADAAIRAGATLLEIGFPYSDPIADGPVIQASYTRALAKGIKLDDVFAAAAAIRERHPSTPLVAMASFSLVLRRGMAAFAAKAAASGFSGLIAPDLPAEESDALADACAAAGVSLVQLVTPTTDPARLDRVLAKASGFVYVVSVAGITGERKELSSDLPAYLASLRKRTSLPLCVGFGVSRPEHVRGLRGHADGVIVGSAFVRKIEEGGPAGPVAERVAALARELAAEA